MIIVASYVFKPLKERENLVLRSPGGKDAVREFSELVMKQRNV